jgi:hypothetical protein
VVLRTTPPVDETVPSCLVEIDTLAAISLFKNAELLTNVRSAPTPTQVSGIHSEGEKLYCDLIGDFEPLGITAYYNPHASANVVCFFDACKECRVEWDQPMMTLTTHHNESGATIVFTAADNDTSERKLFISDLTDHFKPTIPVANIRITTADIQSVYSQRELQKAHQSDIVQYRMGYPLAEHSLTSSTTAVF